MTARAKTKRCLSRSKGVVPPRHKTIAPHAAPFLIRRREFGGVCFPVTASAPLGCPVHWLAAMAHSLLDGSLRISTAPPTSSRVDPAAHCGSRGGVRERTGSECHEPMMCRVHMCRTPLLVAYRPRYGCSAMPATRARVSVARLSHRRVESGVVSLPRFGLRLGLHRTPSFSPLQRLLPSSASARTRRRTWHACVVRGGERRNSL